MLAVEHYSLSQSIFSCVGIKINSVDSQCVLDDPDSTNLMRNLAHRGGFLGECVTDEDGGIDLSGHRYEGICYHTNVNAAFTS